MRTRRRLIVRHRPLIRRLRYHRATRWIAAALAVTVGLGLAHRMTAAAAAERHRWGETRRVVVARQRIAMGTTITADAVELQTWPLALVPDGTLDALPVGRTAVAAIEHGEAVVGVRVAPSGLHGLAALVPSGWRAIAIPVAPTVVALTVGDHVDLVAGFDRGGAPSEGSASLTIARDAIVVGVDEQRVTVAVPGDDAERVALAVIAGTVMPALRSG